MLTAEQVQQVLNEAIDTGDWHTPHASDVKFSELSNSQCAYGWCNISLHSNYHDKEHWFSINKTSVHIWVKEYQKGRIDKSHYLPIYNLPKLVELINQFTNV